MMMNDNGYLILDKAIWYVITCISIGNSMISSDIWHKYHE